MDESVSAIVRFGVYPHLLARVRRANAPLGGNLDRTTACRLLVEPTTLGATPHFEREQRTQRSQKQPLEPVQFAFESKRLGSAEYQLQSL